MRSNSTIDTSRRRDTSLDSSSHLRKLPPPNKHKVGFTQIVDACESVLSQGDKLENEFQY